MRWTEPRNFQVRYRILQNGYVFDTCFIWLSPLSKYKISKIAHLFVQSYCTLQIYYDSWKISSSIISTCNKIHIIRQSFFFIQFSLVLRPVQRCHILCIFYLVSLNCPFLIDSSIFSNVYFRTSGFLSHALYVILLCYNLLSLVSVMYGYMYLTSSIMYRVVYIFSCLLEQVQPSH